MYFKKLKLLTMIKKITTILFFIFFTNSFTQQNDQITVEGFIYDSLNMPLKNVNIKLKDKTNVGTISDNYGYYKITTNVNDVLQFSYVGYKTQNILITKETKILNITLKLEENLLDEVVINKKKRKPKRTIYKVGRSFVNVSSRNYLEGNQFNKSATSIEQALIGKIPGLKVRHNSSGEVKVFLRGGPVLWDVDGMTTTRTPQISPDQIKSVVILRSLSETTMYGTDGKNGVIVVNTALNEYQKAVKDINSSENPYTNKIKYNNDAIPYNKLTIGTPEYLDAFKNIVNGENAISLFKKIETKYRNNEDFYLDLIYFSFINYDKEYTTKIIELSKKHLKNTKYNLFFLSFVYDCINDHFNSIHIHKKLIKLNPKHQQSYRNLASSFLNIKDYKNAWKAYKYYLIKGFKIENNDLGKVINSEMINTYIHRKKDTNFKDKFYAKKSDDLISEADIRLIFEWNEHEAEFSLEFVNSNGQVHTEENTQENILQQKIKGYNIKEFIIDGVNTNTNDWIINLTYQGNKQHKPTYFKVTEYKNWGRKNQTKKTTLFKILLKDTKYQLLKIKPN